MAYPSFFYRLYETEQAFREVTEESHNRRYSHIDGNRKSHRIVGECLDILELLSMPDSRVRIVPIGWNDLAINCIRDPRYRDNIKNTVVEDAEELFGSKSDCCFGVILKDNVVLGGLSPLTLVYSRPDLERICPNVIDLRNRALYGQADLMQRPKTFIRYMMTLAKYNLLPRVMKDYVMACISAYMYTGGKPNPADDILDQKVLERWSYPSGEKVNIGSFSIFRVNTQTLISCSGYVIRNSKISAAAKNTPIPLVLGRLQTEFAPSYISEYKWNPSEKPHSQSDDLAERILPMTGIRYPFLLEDDLLEDKLVVCESIDSLHFPDMLYALDDGIGVLLPLRQRFFDYFGVEEAVELLTIRHYDDGSVSVNLSIPVAAGTVKFYKKYRGEEIVVIGTDVDFNLAVTPFLASDALPRHIFSLQGGCYANMRFINSKENEEVRSEVRSVATNGRDNFVFVTTEEEWDYVAIKLYKTDRDACEGIVIPKFKSISNNGREHCFSILLGDKSISVMESDPIGTVQYPLSMDGDFVCCAMAENSLFQWMMKDMFMDGSCDFKSIGMRIPTSVNLCRDITTPAMLAGCNITFDVKSQLPANWRRIADLFQRDLRNHEEELSLIYCQEIAFLIKTACLGKNMENHPAIRIEVPGWMSAANARAFRRLWVQAFQTVDVPAHNIEFIFRLPARCSAIARLSASARKTIYVDIDAYHTTLVYMNPITHTSVSRSLEFGVNDLYGDKDDIGSYAENPYVSCIVNSGRCEEAWRMKRDKVDSLDIIEHAIDGKVLPCIDDRAFRLPYLLFVRVIKEAVGEFAKSVIPDSDYEVVFMGYGMKFLDVWHMFEETFGLMVQGNVGIRNLMIFSDYDRYLRLPINCQDTHEIADMVEINLNDGSDGQGLHHRLAHEVKDEVLERVWKHMEEILSKEKEFGGVGRYDRDELKRLMRFSYDRCLKDFMRTWKPTAELSMSDVACWPYRYSLKELGLEGYM